MEIIDFILHFDEHLEVIIQNYGIWTYLILFAIIFAETGLVVTPFLPGDSLIFVAGTFAARGAIDISFLTLLLMIAAIIGDTVNYHIGHHLGRRAFREDKKFFIKKEYLQRTEKFYEKYGKKTIILARFVPIVRTFAPFVAGTANMNYKTFLSYNVIGGVIWVCLFSLTGYFFGNLPWVEKNFTAVIFAVIFLSFLPPLYEYFKEKRKSRRI